MRLIVRFQGKTGSTTESTACASLWVKTGTQSPTNHQLETAQRPLTVLPGRPVLPQLQRSEQGSSRLTAPATALDSGCLAKEWRLWSSSRPIPVRILGCGGNRPSPRPVDLRP
jgi:hypothetical protein